MPLLLKNLLKISERSSYQDPSKCQQICENQRFSKWDVGAIMTVQSSIRVKIQGPRVPSLTVGYKLITAGKA